MQSRQREPSQGRAAALSVSSQRQHFLSIQGRGNGCKFLLWAGSGAAAGPEPWLPGVI